MAPIFKLLHELDPSNVNQAVKVGLIRFFALHDGDDKSDAYSLECVFHDLIGSRIHASIKRSLIPRFRSILMEEHIYAIQNIVLTNNNLRVKTCSSMHRMIFTSNSNMVEVFDPTFPRNVFEFKAYDDLSMWNNIDDDLLVDVIGFVSRCSSRQSRDSIGRETMMVDITLKNLKGNIISCTLWGSYADEMVSEVENNEGHVIVIMQMCRMRKLLGQVCVSNSFKISKVIFSHDVPEIDEFSRGFVTETYFEESVSNFLPSTAITISEDLHMNRNKIVSLKRLITVNEIGKYWVLCQVVGIEPMFDWFYMSCKVCLRKMAPYCSTYYCVNCDTADSVYVSCNVCMKRMCPCGSKFYCVHCDKSVTEGSLRYKVVVRVSDNWGSASFIIGDKECLEIIGKSATELQASNGQIGFPTDLSKLVGIRGLFKVNVKEISSSLNYGPFHVLKMSTDLSLINQFSNIANVCNVGNVEKDESDNPLAPLRSIRTRDVPTHGIVVVKHNLFGEISGEEEVSESKKARIDGCKIMECAVGVSVKGKDVGDLMEAFGPNEVVNAVDVAVKEEVVGGSVKQEDEVGTSSKKESG